MKSKLFVRKRWRNGRVTIIDWRNGRVTKIDWRNGSVTIIDWRNGRVPIIDWRNGRVTIIDQNATYCERTMPPQSPQKKRCREHTQPAMTCSSPGAEGLVAVTGEPVEKQFFVSKR